MELTTLLFCFLASQIIQRLLDWVTCFDFVHPPANNPTCKDKSHHVRLQTPFRTAYAPSLINFQAAATWCSSVSVAPTANLRI